MWIDDYLMEPIEFRMESTWKWIKGKLVCLWRGAKTMTLNVQNETCTNCGRVDTFMPHCHMRDRCVQSQNNVRVELLPMDEVNRLIKAGKRITIENPRALCFKCANDNNYICAWCELEQSLEKNK